MLSNLIRLFSRNNAGIVVSQRGTRISTAAQDILVVNSTTGPHGRFVDRIAGGCQIQLLLNHEHPSLMEATMTRLAAA
jgi:hypothetical protein